MLRFHLQRSPLNRLVNPQNVVRHISSFGSPTLSLYRSDALILKSINMRNNPYTSQNKFKWFSSQSTMSQSAAPQTVLPYVSKAARLVGRKLSYPQIGVFGQQSSGKTSVIEAITGFDIYHKTPGMGTRRPLNIECRRTDAGVWVEFDDGEKMFDLVKVKARLLEENNAVDTISHDPINITLFAPWLQDCSLVDIPGIIVTYRGEGGKEIPKRILEIFQKYITDKNIIPLVVLSATEDLETNNALGYVTQNDREKDSVGIVSKIDLVKSHDAAIKLLNNESFPLGNGYFGVVLRDAKDLNVTSIDQMLKNEENYFADPTKDFHKFPGLNLGIPKLRDSLSRIQLNSIVHRLPSIIEQLNVLINEIGANRNFLEELAKEKDKKTISKDLEFLMNRLNAESDTRAAFEKHLREKFKVIVEEKIAKAFDRYFKDSENEYTSLPDSNETMPYIHDGANLDLDIGREYNLDIWKKMFLFGRKCPEDVDNQIIHQSMMDFLKTRLVMYYFRLIYPKDLSLMRSSWLENLELAIQDLLYKKNINDDDKETVIQRVASPTSTTMPFSEQKETVVSVAGFDKSVVDMSDDLPRVIYSATMASLETFFDDIKLPRSTEKTVLAKKFGKFLLDKIGDEIYQSIESSLASIINKEQRPLPHMGDTMYTIAKNIKHPKPSGSFSYIFTRYVSVKRVVLFGKEWTAAYKKTLATKLTDEICQTIYVNFLNPLVFRCIQKTLTTIISEQSIVMEKNRNQQKKLELEECKAKLEEAYRDHMANKSVVKNSDSETT